MPALLRGLFAALMLTAPELAAQALPKTTAERSNYASTSSNDEVGAFLDSLELAGAPIAVSELGRTALGKPIFFVIASDPPVTSPGEAAAAGKLVVYLQANIHAGEVEGKEAVLAMLRELAGPSRDLLRQLVILVAPDYNPDGNDALGPQAVNRSEQNGPELVGRRADGLNLDLNRDYFKAEAPETRASLARVYNAWDPALMVDLHTTDGTLHGYHLTYAPPLDPNGPAGPTDFVRNQMLPALRKTLQDKYREPTFDYGNVETPLVPKSWDTYAPLGWYGTNYVGLRGRMAILSEAYSHDDFRTRVRVTHDFLIEILTYASLHADEIRRLEREADRQTALEGVGLLPRPRLAVAYKIAGRGVEPVVLEVMKPNPDTGRGRPALLPTGELRTYRLPVNDRFVDSLTRPLPAGYFLPAGRLFSPRGRRRRRRSAAPARHPGPAPGRRTDRHGGSAHGHAAEMGRAGVSGTPSARGDGGLGAPDPHSPRRRLLRAHGAAARSARVRVARARGVWARSLGRFLEDVHASDVLWRDPGEHRADRPARQCQVVHDEEWFPIGHPSPEAVRAADAQRVRPVAETKHLEPRDSGGQEIFHPPQACVGLGGGNRRHRRGRVLLELGSVAHGDFIVRRGGLESRRSRSGAADQERNA